MFFRVAARTLEVLEWPGLQHQLSHRARTPMGRLVCAEYIPGRLSQEEATLQAEACLDAADLKQDGNLQLPLSETPDLGNILQRISRSGAISVEEFANLVRFQKIAQALQHFLQRYAAKKTRLLRCLSGIDLLEEWSRQHFPLLDTQGDLVDSASEDLRALRILSRELHQKIRDRLDDYLHNPKLTELMQDFYVTVRDGRYVIPVKTNFRGRVPGIVHDVSNTEATIFVEPQEIVEWNNQLKVTEKEIEKEIARILEDVVSRSKPYLRALTQNQEIIAKADLVSAAAFMLLDWGGQATVAKWGEKIDFNELRHPLLSLNRPVIANTYSWTQGFILTGPNTGGKTVLLKSTGLAAAMAWAGLPVSAKHAEIPKDLGGIFADIGDDQSLESNLSTFSGHLVVLKEMIESAQPGDLVLIDEIATGTSPEEGQPLAQAVIEGLLDRKARLFVTTHYGGLKKFAMTDERCRIASMSFDSKTRRPTYEIILDIPGESSAFEIADQMGLPHSVIERARQLRGDTPKEVRSAVERLELARDNFLKREEKLSEAERSARAREEKAAQKIADYESKQREGLSQEARDILKNLSILRDELSAAVKKAASADVQSGASSLFTKISDAGDNIRSVIEGVGRFEAGAAELKDDEIKADAIVEVEGFGVGRIVETPKDLSRGAKAQVSVQIGDLQVAVSRSKLYKPSADQLQRHKAAKAASQAARDRRSTVLSDTSPTQRTGSARGTGSIVCDVRGRTVDEAIRKIDQSLNELARFEDTIITIIHGHGSDRLKDSIRTYLSKERSDLAYRSGSWPGEGGDGVTVVERAH